MSIWLLPRLELTPEQLRIVDMPPDKHRVVLGFPGSGKTQILIHRADQLSKTYNLSDVLDVLRKKKELQKKLEFVLIDEGQDLTAQAYEILFLAARHITVFADPMQQIFENGASESFILKQLGLSRHNASLLGAYRNAPYVAQLASGFIEDDQKRSQYLFQINTEQKVRELPLCYVAPDFDKEIDRLAEIISQRQAMNEQIGIIVPTNKQLYGFSNGLEERGVTVEKAVASGRNNSYDFGNSLPKIVTYFSAKGLTFDSVLLPRLTESSFSWIGDLSLRTRLFFVGIARATQWVYLSTVKGKEFSEMKIIRKAEAAGHITVQYTFDTKKIEPKTGLVENFEDEFSVL